MAHLIPTLLAWYPALTAAVIGAVGLVRVLQPSRSTSLVPLAIAGCRHA